ncbi:RTA-like protein, partial [Infundibulicybe gibba]
WARFWSSTSPDESAPFQIQIVMTIIAATPLVAANFVILGRVVHQLGTSYSWLSPRLYRIIFTLCDVTALFTQAAGGSIDSNVGVKIMLGGVVFQLAIIVAYALLGVEFFVRYLKDAPLKWKSPSKANEGSARGLLDKHMQILITSLVFSTTCLFIRSVYRTFELSDGFNGKVFKTEVYFNVLDGGMVTLAMFTLNFAHPGLLLKKQAASSAHPGRRCREWD